MPESTTIAGLKIGRHTAQQLLLEAIKHRPGRSSGSFVVEANEVTAVTPFGRSKQESNAAGIYYSSFDSDQPDSRLIDALVREHGLDGIRFCLVVALDTEGRMEALAYTMNDAIFTPIPLEMEEDHDLYPVRANG